MEQFRIHFHEEKWNDLQHRIDSTRFPKPFLRENGDLAWMTDTCPHSYPIGDMTMTGRAKKQS